MRFGSQLVRHDLELRREGIGLRIPHVGEKLWASLNGEQSPKWIRPDEPGLTPDDLSLLKFAVDGTLTEIKEANALQRPPKFIKEFVAEVLTAEGIALGAQAVERRGLELAFLEEYTKVLEVIGRRNVGEIVSNSEAPDMLGTIPTIQQTFTSWKNGHGTRGEKLPSARSVQDAEPLHDIDMSGVSKEFESCWMAAGRQIQQMAQGPLHSWLKAVLKPPFLEHLSFRLGNQLFFIRLEDVDGRLAVPGSRSGLITIADGCKGHACLMPMRSTGAYWSPNEPGWGLIDVRTGREINPAALVSDERIEMTDWELQDFGVQVVRDMLEKAGRRLMSWHRTPETYPSLWFTGSDGPEWVVVGCVRYPRIRAIPPKNWTEIAERCARTGTVGHFASVSIANADAINDPFHSADGGMLLRGHALSVKFEGLESVPLS